MMNNDPQLLEKIRTVLQSPASWQIVSGFFPPGKKAIFDPENAGWRARHEDIHQATELLLGISGKAICRFQNACYEVGSGDWMVFHHGEHHDYGYAPSVSDAIHGWFFLENDYISIRFLKIENGIFEPVGLWYHIDDLIFRNWVIHEFDQIRLHAASRITAEMSLRAILQLLAARLLNALAEPARNKDKHLQIVRLIERMIVNQNGKNISGEKIAVLAGYSHYHFLRIFKRVTGKTLNQYTNDVRMARLTAMEEKGCLRKEIAEAIGFSSASALSHWYKKQVLIDPS